MVKIEYFAEKTLKGKKKCDLFGKLEAFFIYIQSSVQLLFTVC